MIRLFVIFILGFCLLSFQSVCGQEEFSTDSKRAIKNYKMALNKYSQRDYSETLFFIDEAIKDDGLFVEAYLLKADLSKTTDNIAQEISSYRKVLNINPDFFIYTSFNLGVALYNNGEYKEALQFLKGFVNKNVGKEQVRKKAKRQIERCIVAIELVNNPVEFNPISVGKGINDLNDQYWPSLSLDGKTMIYTVLLTDSSKISMYNQFAKQEDFYISTREDGCWQQSNPIGPPLNTSGNEGAHKVSADGKTIVFTGCNRRDGFGNCDIYFSFKENGQWTMPINAGRTINTPYSEKQPSLSPDGRFLYFSSNRPEGEGKMDIWVSEKIGNRYWTMPINMGDGINTDDDEVSPFIHPDNRTFYFSSSGHNGLGKKDIFYSRLDSIKEWSTPVNIGYPINTHLDEIGLIVDAKGELAYYSTNYNSESTNIFSFKMPNEVKPNAVSYLSGHIFDENTKEPLQSKFQLINLSYGDTVMQSSSNKKDGKYLVCLPSGFNYGLSVSHPGYLFYSINFNFNGMHSLVQPYELNIPLKRISIGNTVVLENIFFNSDSYDLLADSDMELMKIYEFAKFNPEIELEIGGHTDNTGTQEYNISLSEKRAKAVYDYLIEKGISAHRLTYKGYGQNKPIIANDSVEDKAKNRRTELKVISNPNN